MNVTDRQIAIARLTSALAYQRARLDAAKADLRTALNCLAFDIITDAPAVLGAERIDAKILDLHGMIRLYKTTIRGMRRALRDLGAATA